MSRFISCRGEGAITNTTFKIKFCFHFVCYLKRKTKINHLHTNEYIVMQQRNEDMILHHIKDEDMIFHTVSYSRVNIHLYYKANNVGGFYLCVIL